MRKLFGYFILLLSLSIYVISSSQDLTRALTYLKINASYPFKTDKYRFGDLYGLTYLSQFRKAFPTDKIAANSCSRAKDIDLYAICDSYIWSFVDSAKNYCGVDNLRFAKINNKQILDIDLDKKKVNVLLLELGERNIRVILLDPAYVENAITVRSSSAFQSSADKRSQLVTDMEAVIFNKDINLNIESNIWDFAIFTPLKEFKAGVNASLFHSIDKNVRLSDDGRQLFYAKTIDTINKTTSSFNYVSRDELDTLVSRINTMARHGRNLGFDRVILSLVPNPVSILEPAHKGLYYNHLIDRIQRSPNLVVEYIDLLPAFSLLKKKVYFLADTHWNYDGAKVWLNMFNQILVTTKKMEQPSHAK